MFLVLFSLFCLFLSYPVLSGFVCHSFILLLLTRYMLVFFLKDRKFMDMVGRDGGENIGGVREGKTVIRINCIKIFFYEKKRKIKRDHISSCGNRPSEHLRVYIHLKDNSYQPFIINVPHQAGAIFPGMKDECSLTFLKLLFLTLLMNCHSSNY